MRNSGRIEEGIGQPGAGRAAVDGAPVVEGEQLVPGKGVHGFEPALVLDHQAAEGIGAAFAHPGKGDAARDEEEADEYDQQDSPHHLPASSSARRRVDVRTNMIARWISIPIQMMMLEI